MRVWLALGTALGLVGAGCLGVEVALYFRTAFYDVLTLGRLWSWIDDSGLHSVRAATADHGPWAEALLAGVLRLPAWAVAGVPAVLSVWAAWPAAAVTSAASGASEDGTSVSDATDP